MVKWDVFKTQTFEKHFALETDAVRHMIRRGDLRPTDCIRRAGSETWRRVGEIAAAIVASAGAGPCADFQDLWQDILAMAPSEAGRPKYATPNQRRTRSLFPEKHESSPGRHKIEHTAADATAEAFSTRSERSSEAQPIDDEISPDDATTLGTSKRFKGLKPHKPRRLE